MKADQIYIELRQIKLDAVNAEIGWYNGRRQEAYDLVGEMLRRLFQIQSDMIRTESVVFDPYGNTTLDFGKFTCKTCGSTFDKCSEEHGKSGECAGCEVGRQIAKDWRAE